MAKKKTLKQILIELGAYEKFKETWKKQKPAHYQKNAAIVLKSTKVIKYNAILHGEIWDARIVIILIGGNQIGNTGTIFVFKYTKCHNRSFKASNSLF